MALRLAFLVAVIGLLGLGTANSAVPVKRALLIGINKYAAVTPLHGTLNDVQAMKALLINRFEFEESNITVLIDERATRENILTEIRRSLIERASSGDVAVFYFSGHGSFIKDVSRDESDGWDETIVPQDSRQEGKFDISDDELNRMFAELAHRTDNVTVILDSCHSGTAARASAAAIARTIPADERMPPGPASAMSLEPTEDDRSDVRQLGANFVLLSGAAAGQLSYEDRFEGKQQGAFTYHFVKALQSAPENSYRSIFPMVSERVTALFPSQEPQHEGSGLDSYVFGPRMERAESYVLVEPVNAQTVRIAGGELYGLAKNVELDIYSPGAGPIGTAAPIGRAKISEVDVDTARATLLTAGAVPPHSRARLSTLGFAATPTGVYLDPTVASSLRLAIAQKLRAYPSIQVLNAKGDAAKAEFRLMHEAGAFQIVGRDGQMLGQPIPASGNDIALVVATQLHAWVRWRSVLTLANPYSGLQLEVSIRPREAPDSAPSITTVANGTVISVRVQNRSTERVHFALLNLTSAGRIKLQYPAAGAAETLDSGASFERLYQMGIPQGRSEITDVFKVIAATVPFDAGVLEQGPIGEVKARGGALEQLLLDRAGARPRDSTPVRLKDWNASQATVRVEKQSARLAQPSFALVFNEPKQSDAVVRMLAADRAICAEGTAPESCATVRALSADNQVFEVKSPSLKASRGAGSGATPSIGRAFQEAYELQARTGADYAEPLVTIEMPEPAPAGPGARGGDSQPDPIAAGDELWSLRYAGVAGAWDVAQQAGKPAGAEAAGILVAHLDTGYTRHPENVTGATPSPIAFEKGYDYIERKTDALDPMVEEGLFPNPGHGTASGSVIVSPLGCQLADRTRCVSGVAQGARLIPLRVHTSVAVFDTKRLIEAIEDAAAGSRFGKVDLVSIAMGGPPSRALLRAVRKAERNGVIIVAAAGNHVRTVVWPARFDASIAVAAINPQCKPWSGSSRGRAVDISAPGENVWRATFDGQRAFDIAMGAGTTFATGTTAGIAALWLARFSDDPLMSQLREQGKITQAFRAAAAATSWRPNAAQDLMPPSVTCPADTGWNPKAFGPGIINAEAILKRPLAMPAARAVDAAEDSAVPLFGSLFEVATPAQVEAAYGALFPGTALPTVARFETEILFHYTMSDEVRLAMDRLVDGAEPIEAGRVIRAALRAQDLSQQLRDALGAA